MALLCQLGVIKVLKPKQWCGVGNPANRAATYDLPKDETTSETARRWFYSTWTRQVGRDAGLAGGGEGGGDSIYIRDSCPFAEQDIKEFILEVERLNRPWKPQYHSSG